MRSLNIDEIRDVSAGSIHSSINVEVRLSLPLSQLTEYSNLFAQFAGEQINENIFFQTLADFAANDDVNIHFIQFRFYQVEY